MKNWLWGAIGTVTLCLGMVMSAVGFLQPGLTCPGEDSSAGCPSTPLYSGMLGFGIVLLLASILFLIRAGKTKG